MHLDGAESLPALLLDAARARGDQPFLLHGPRDAAGERSFAAIADDAGRAAARLAAIVAPGDRVAVLLPAGPAYVAAVFGVLLAGGVAVPLDLRLHPREIGFLLAHCRCAALIADGPAPELLSSHPPASPAPPGCRALAAAEILARSAPSPIDRPPPIAADAPAIILPTSGSTAAPKAVVLSHRALLEDQRRFAARYALTEGDVLLGPLSLAHSFGLTALLLAALGAGASLLIPDDILPERLAALAFARRATVFIAAASYYQYLVRSAACAPGDLATVRLFLGGACALPGEIASAFRARFGAEILQTYGLTEAAPVVTANPPGENRPGTVGAPLDGVELRILGEDGAARGPGEDGELCVRGPIVMLGYFDNAAATAACLGDDGWLRTGDLARVDADGYVTLLGRRKDLIIRAGAKIYPDEIEEVLQQHPGVAEAAVVGMADPAYEEVPVAFIVAAGARPPDAAELRAFCRERLALYKIPRLFRAVEALPRGRTGKVLKATLRAWLAEGGGA